MSVHWTGLRFKRKIMVNGWSGIQRIFVKGRRYDNKYVIEINDELHIVKYYELRRMYNQRIRSDER